LDEARAIFREQAEGLAEGGVEFFILETFSDLAEIGQAIRAVREVSDLPLIAQMTGQEDGLTVYGTAPDAFTAQLDEWDADVIGLNCSVGPHGILLGIEQIAACTSKPLSAQPNAGLPRDIQGRTMYMASPEYMATYSARLIRAGARFIGGCCGTTPEHIKRIADAVHAIAPRQTIVDVKVPEHDAPEVKPVALAHRSNWGMKIATGRLVTTVEIVPPKGI